MIDDLFVLAFISRCLVQAKIMDSVSCREWSIQNSMFFSKDHPFPSYYTHSAVASATP